MDVEKLVKLVNEDCKIRHTYRDADGNTCVIGYLAVKAGLEHLLPAVDSEGNEARLSCLDGLRDALCEFYGVTEDLLGALQSDNDANAEVEHRRAAISSTLRNW